MRVSFEAILVQKSGVVITPKAFWRTAMSKRAKWKILVTEGSARRRTRLGAAVLTGGDLDDVGAAVAGRKLDEAEAVAMRIEAEGLGVDRH